MSLATCLARVTPEAAIAAMVPELDAADEEAAVAAPLGTAEALAAGEDGAVAVLGDMAWERPEEQRRTRNWRSAQKSLREQKQSSGCYFSIFQTRSLARRWAQKRLGPRARVEPRGRQASLCGMPTNL